MATSYITRYLEKNLGEYLDSFPVITITGPRQSGKTTLIKRYFSDYAYFSLEYYDVRSMAEKDPNAFLNHDKRGMILDEVQNLPLLMSYIQGIVDENPDRRFVLSGSSQFALMKQVSQSLAGRTAVLELLPFSCNEICDSLSQLSLDKILINGFYPAVYSGRSKPHLLYPSYIKTYLERDVRNLLNIKDMSMFRTFMSLCAGRVGKLFNASELSCELGVSANTIKSWLSVLQASYIVFMLPPYFANVEKRLVKTPKLYFYDTGIVCSLLGIETEQQLMYNRMRGSIFENFIVSEVVKYRFNNGKSNNLMFYRDSNGVEIDLLLPNGDKYCGLEIKSSQTYNTDFEKGFYHADVKLIDKMPCKAVVYSGTLKNDISDIKLLNYINLYSLLNNFYI